MQPTSEPSDELRRLAADVRRSFLIMTPCELLAPLEAYQTSQGPVGHLSISIAQALSAIVTSTSLPFTMAMSAVRGRRHHSLYLAESIRALHHHVANGVITEEDRQAAHRHANVQIEAELETAAGQQHMRDGTVDYLSMTLNSPDIRDAAQSLLRQAVVSVWSVFEVFTGDFITRVVDKHPNLGLALLNSELTRKHFGGKASIPIETIAEYGFDLRSSMGQALLSSRRLDSLGVVIDLLKVIDPDGVDALTILKSNEMRLLNQRRHLIVHKMAFVDASYLKLSGDVAAVGDRVHITSDDVERYLVMVRDAALAMISSKLVECH